MNQEPPVKKITYGRIHDSSQRGIVMSHAYGNTHPTPEELKKFEEGPLAAASDQIKQINTTRSTEE